MIVLLSGVFSVDQVGPGTPSRHSEVTAAVVVGIGVRVTCPAMALAKIPFRTLDRARGTALRCVRARLGMLIPL